MRSDVKYRKADIIKGVKAVIPLDILKSTRYEKGRSFNCNIANCKELQYSEIPYAHSALRTITQTE